jgi:hypothetical protein
MADEPDPGPESSSLQFEIKKHAHERWWREDELVNQRMTWLLTTQGVLGTAFGFILYRIAEVNYSLESPPKLYTVHYVNILSLFSNFLVAIGIGSSFMSFMGILAACLAQYSLRKQCGDFLGVTVWTTWMGHLVAVFTPILCVIAWNYGLLLLLILITKK